MQTGCGNWDIFNIFCTKSEWKLQVLLPATAIYTMRLFKQGVHLLYVLKICIVNIWIIYHYLTRQVTICSFEDECISGLELNGEWK